MLLESKFLPPGYYIRLWCPDTKQYDYYRLLEREALLSYPIRIKNALGALGSGTETSKTIFLSDLNPKKEHIYMGLFGVKSGSRWYYFQPTKTQNLLLDETALKPSTEIETVTIDDTSYIDYTKSPYDMPQYEAWIIKDVYPAVMAKNMLDKASNPEAIFYIAKYNYEAVIEADILSKLKIYQVPSYPIRLGALE